MHGRLSAVLFSTCLAACSSTGAVTHTTTNRYVTIPPDLARDAAKVTDHATAPPRSRTIGPVTATACQYADFDPLPTREYALALLKRSAVANGANGLVDVTYSESHADLLKNCWENIVASGTAIATN
ncbi:hypothetical protein RA307_28040 [Xanthobacteraceae bacterium Astr-EGSB]|uniref:hypothetical protein n=1 Tax=Astrobacterium formosum TaxID=3069710 RepID=UPI0027B4E1C8|nr:hypothetical protein [Xanthobacteraceae bacterium Astr-EGSB]